MIAYRIQFEFDVQYTRHTTAVKVFRRINSNREKFCKALLSRCQFQVLNKMPILTEFCAV